jgi:hypothetical protein
MLSLRLLRGIKTDKLCSILDRPPEFNMDIQVRIPCALAAVHNFIMDHDEEDIEDFADILESMTDSPTSLDELGELADGSADRRERRRATTFRDEVAQQMWDDYQVYIGANNV